MLKFELDTFNKATFANRFYDGTDAEIPPAGWDIVGKESQGVRDMVAFLRPDAAWVRNEASSAFFKHDTFPRDKPAHVPHSQGI